MKKLAAEMVSVVGDATKTALFLSCAMVERAGEALRGGAVPKALIAGMQKAVEVAVTHVMTEAKSVDESSLRSVARTAAGSDDNIATIVVEGLKKVGQDGAVEILDGNGPEPQLEVREGMQFDSGFLSQSFITDSQRQECVLEDCFILIYEGQIGSMRVLLPVLEQVARAKRPLLVIASDLAQEAMATLIVNKEKGTLASAAVKAPGQGDRRRGYLEDIAVLTRGRAFLQERMRPLEEATLDDLGRAEKVIVSRGDTTIIGGAGDPKEIISRVNSLRRQIEATLSPYDNAKLRERLAKLAGAIGVIRSGGLTETDRTDSRYKLESAVFSCQSAIKNGYVVGGGLRCYRAIGLIEKLVAANESEQHGINAVSYALELPLRQLVENSSIYNKKKLLDEIIESTSPDIGFNAEEEKVEDLAKAGVLDPVQGLREALTLAFAHAKGILMTGAWDAEPSAAIELPQG
jgi:chaperonin GroEL